MRVQDGTTRATVPWLILLGGVATLVMAVVALLRPDYAWRALFFFVIGLFGTLRQYRRWRAGQHGES